MPSYEMDISQDFSGLNALDSNWSKVLLYDSTELLGKQPNRPHRRNRQLFAKPKYSPTPFKFSKFGVSPYANRLRPHQKIAPKNVQTQREKGNNFWNMLIETLNVHSGNNHKLDRNNEVFGVRDSANNIRLIKDRKEFEKQILVDAKGRQSYAKDLINQNDIYNNGALKVQFRLVPVIEKLTVLDLFAEKSFIFDDAANEINNNDTIYDSESMEVDEVNSSSESTLTYDSEVHNNSAETTDVTSISFDMNSSILSTESEYSDFLMELELKNEISRQSIKKSTPVCSTPIKESPKGCKTFFESPTPRFAKKAQTSSWFGFEHSKVYEMLSTSKKLKAMNENIRNALSRIESVCTRFIRFGFGNIRVDFSLSGVHLISDSIEI